MLTEERWLGRFARLFHLNRVRLKHYTPEGGLDEQPWKFRTAQRQLQSALNRKRYEEPTFRIWF